MVDRPEGGWPGEIAEAIEQGRFERAWAFALQRAQDADDDPQSLALAADVALLRHDLESAKKWADQCLRRSPDDVEAHLRCIRIDGELSAAGVLDRHAASFRLDSLVERAHELGVSHQRLLVATLRSRFNTRSTTSQQMEAIFDGLADGVIANSPDSLGAEMWTLEATLISAALTGSFLRWRAVLVGVGLLGLVVSSFGPNDGSAAVWYGAVLAVALSWVLKVAAYVAFDPRERMAHVYSRRLYLQNPSELFPHLSAYLRLVGFRFGRPAVARSIVEVGRRYSGVRGFEPSALVWTVRRAYFGLLAKDIVQLAVLALIWMLAPNAWVGSLVLVIFVVALATKRIVRTRARTTPEMMDALDADGGHLGFGVLDRSTITVHSTGLRSGAIDVGDVPNPLVRRVLLIATGALGVIVAGELTNHWLPSVALGLGIVLPTLVVLRDYEVLVHRSRTARPPAPAP